MHRVTRRFAVGRQIILQTNVSTKTVGVTRVKKRDIYTKSARNPKKNILLKIKVLEAQSVRLKQGEKGKMSSKLHFMEDSESDEDKETWPIFSIKAKGQKEIKVSLFIEEVTQTMELDTGSPVSQRKISELNLRTK